MAQVSEKKRRSTQRGDATRERILEAAATLLSERGYAGLRIARICERADVSPTSVYWQFGSKAGLMEAIIERTGGGHLPRIRAAVDGASSSGTAARLDALIAALHQLVTEQPLGSITSVAVVSEGRHATPELLAALKKARESELDSIAGELAAKLELEGSRANAIATMTIAATNYAALIFRLDGDRAEVDRVLAALRETIGFLTEPSRKARSRRSR